VSDSGLPKLLDFGIATTLDLGRGDAPSSTTDSVFLSPQTAAPEQFLGLPRSVATDVYALGVLLCELMAGARPFESAAMAAARTAPRDNHRPRLPSQAATAAAAQLRGGLQLPALRRKLRGDIDAIAAKALDASPQQRYASVDHLDADLLRHLESRPVHVRRGERGYRLGRFLRRNALPVLLSAALAMLLAGFGVTAVVQNRRLAGERDLAQARAREALFEQTRAQQITDFMIGLFQSATPEQARGHEPTARELLARGREQLEARPQLQADLRAALLATISDAHLALDDLDGAEKTAREAAQLRDDAQPAVPGQQAASLRQLAHIANQRGHPVDALALVQRAHALGVAAGAEDRAALLAVEAAALEGLGRPKEAVGLWRDVLAAETAAYGEDDVRTLRTAMRLAHVLRTLGLADEAERILQENLPREQRSFSRNDPALGETLQDLAIFARNRGELTRAQPLASQALEIYRTVYGDSASQTAAAMNTLATIAQANNDFDQARSLFEQALTIKRAVYGSDSAQVASAQYNLGLLLLLRLHLPAQAAEHLQEAGDIGARALPADHTNLANYRLALGSSLRELGRLDEAERVLRRALLVFQANAAPHGVDVALSRGELACVALARKANPDAERDLDAALGLLDQQAQGDPQALRLHACRSRF
jgi:serine/threonine-protein kinase